MRTRRSLASGEGTDAAAPLHGPAGPAEVSNSKDKLSEKTAVAIMTRCSCSIKCNAVLKLPSTNIQQFYVDNCNVGNLTK